MNLDAKSFYFIAQNSDLRKKYYVIKFNYLNNAVAYKYDKDGNLTQVTNAKGSSKKYEYDALNRPHQLHRISSIVDQEGRKPRSSRQCQQL